MTSTKQVSVEEFLAQRKQNPEAVVIDVRDDDKWEDGHIPGAVHIHKTKIAGEIALKVPDKNVEIFCHCGGGQSGPRAAEALREMGYKNAKSISGGFRAYQASGEKIKK